MKKKPIIISLLAAIMIICALVGLFYKPSLKNTITDEEQTNETKWNAATTQYEESEEVWVETQYSVYPEGTRTVTAKWFNKSGSELTGGEFYTLEKQVDGVWRTVEKETDINYAFKCIGYGLPAGGSYWQSYDLIPYTDGLNAGEYRIFSYVIADYPACIQCYGYFKVGKALELRNVTHNAGEYEYVNAEYGFVLNLTPDWEGCKTEVIHDTGDKALNELAKAIDPEWFVLRIRHPEWSEDNPYQDIIFTCVSLEKWDSGDGLEKAVGEDYELLPRRISTDSWMLMFTNNTLDSSLEEYDTVMQALDSMSPIR